MNDIIKNSDPDELEKIAKKIAVYSDQLKKDMRRLASTHQGMRKDWSGKQYDDFTKVIEYTNSVICKQADKLEDISKDVFKDAKELRIGLAKNTGLNNV